MPVEAHLDIDLRIGFDVWLLDGDMHARCLELLWVDRESLQDIVEVLLGERSFGLGHAGRLRDTDHLWDVGWVCSCSQVFQAAALVWASDTFDDDFGVDESTSEYLHAFRLVVA